MGEAVCATKDFTISVSAATFSFIATPEKTTAAPGEKVKINVAITNTSSGKIQVCMHLRDKDTGEILDRNPSLCGNGDLEGVGDFSGIYAFAIDKGQTRTEPLYVKDMPTTALNARVIVCAKF